MLTDAHLHSAKAAWVNKLKAALSKDSKTIIRGEHIINFLYWSQKFDGLGGPRAWVTSVVSDPQLLPIFLVAFVHEGQAHTLGDFVTHKMVSFRLDALLPFVELPKMLDAVRALPTGIDMIEREACNRFIEAANNHLAKPRPGDVETDPTPPKSRVIRSISLGSFGRRDAFFGLSGSISLPYLIAVSPNGSHRTA